MKGELIREYLDKFPDAGSLTLARIIYKDNNALFTSIETVRGAIRYWRGQSGKKNRLGATCNDYFREAPEVKSFPTLPEGFESITEWEIFRITGDHSILILSDIHIPYHVKSVVET